MLKSDQGIPIRFAVNGLPRHVAVFEFNGQTFEINLSLNGEYVRTPSKAYNMVSPGLNHTSTAGNQVLGYHVIFSPDKSTAEFQVFKFHESPAISDKDLNKLNITQQVFDLLTTEYPKRIAIALDAYLLPTGVAKFLLQAKKCTSS